MTTGYSEEKVYLISDDANYASLRVATEGYDRIVLRQDDQCFVLSREAAECLRNVLDLI